MKLNKLILFLAIFFSVVFVIIFVISSTEKNNDYLSKITKFHNARKKEILQQNKKITPTFYKVNRDLIVKATVSKIKGYQLEFITATDGSTLKYIKYAYLDFNTNGTKNRLTLLQNADVNSDFFLPFTDFTTGKTTYGGGRFINLIYKGESELMIDFNQALNFTCAYNPNFICPVPPKYNSLNIEIDAGEMAPKK